MHVQETNVNAYRLELVNAERELDAAFSHVQALKDYLKAYDKEDDSKKNEAEETIKATDIKNETRPIVEDSVSEDSKGEKVEVLTSKKDK